MARRAPSLMAGDRLRRRERRLVLVLVLNLAIVAGEVIGGIASGSLGLLADAAHNVTDVAGVGLALVAVRWARRAPTERRSFGYHRGTVLAAQANGALILAATALIGFEGARRLLRPSSVEGGVVVIVALVALVANTGAALLLRERSSDVNMRAALLHMASDAAASLGVALAGVVIVVTGSFGWLDPAVSLGIGAIIGWQALKLMTEITGLLLESTPEDVDLEEITRTMVAVPGVEDVHDLHVWSLSSEVRALSAHVLLDGHPSLEEAHDVGTAVKAALSAPYGIHHATLELECEGCVDDGSWCSIVDVDPGADAHIGHRH